LISQPETGDKNVAKNRSRIGKERLKIILIFVSFGEFQGEMTN
jgi:hypothetical protein